MFARKSLLCGLLLGASFLVLLGGCSGGGSGGGSNAASTANVASVVILPSKASVFVGYTTQLMATGYDGSSTSIPGVTFTWTSSDASIASVDSTGIVTGKAQGQATITASANGVTSSPVTVAVMPASDLHPLVVDPLKLPAGTAGTAYSAKFTASGGTAPYHWGGATTPPDYQATGGTNGLTLSQYDGTLSGTPIYGGLVPVTIKATDASGYLSEVQYELNIQPGVTTMAITNAPPNGTQGSAYNFQFQTSWTNQTGCNANMLFHDGVIPPGLSFDTSTGALSGTPLTAGRYTFSVSAGTGSVCAPSVSNPYTDIYTYTIDIAPAASGGSAPAGTSNWTRASNAPVLSPSASGWDDYSLTAPSVIKVGATYMMYYGAEDAATHTRQIGLATSPDGKTWTRYPDPVLTPGKTGDFDSFGVLYPTVVYDGAIYHMWYMATDARCNSIGEATSSDGIHWTKHSGALDLGNCDKFGKNYAPGTVIDNNGTYTMWYWAPAGVAIGTATSSDGISWQDNGLINIDSLFASNVTIDRPSVVFDGNTYRMWFGLSSSVTGSTGTNVYRTAIGFASSPDGTHWTRYKDDTSGHSYRIFSEGQAGAWDRPGVGQPWVMLDNGTWRMWYAGGRMNLPLPGYFGYVEGSIGYAVIP